MRTKYPLVTLFLDLSNTELVIRFVAKISLWSKQSFTEDIGEKHFVFAVADKEEYKEELIEYGVYDLMAVYVAWQGVLSPGPLAQNII